MTTDAAWGVVVPVKDTREAKSRLGDIDGDRRQLAIAMAQDTLSAVARAAHVGSVVVVCDRAEDTDLFALNGVTVVVQQGVGLNDAILAGAAALRAAGVHHIAVLPGDLPYLRSDELDTALARGAAFPSACVADRPGRGTTLLTAREGTELIPAYGVSSLARHRDAGAVEILVPVWSGLRRDVDVREDLALADGLSERTRQVVESRRALERRSCVHAQDLRGLLPLVEKQFSETTTMSNVGRVTLPAFGEAGAVTEAWFSPRAWPT